MGAVMKNPEMCFTVTQLHAEGETWTSTNMRGRDGGNYSLEI